MVSEGVSAYPQEVTGLMVRNFLAGGAGINVLARCVGAKVSVIDIGMKEDLAADTDILWGLELETQSDAWLSGTAMESTA